MDVVVLKSQLGTKATVSPMGPKSYGEPIKMLQHWIHNKKKYFQ